MRNALKKLIRPVYNPAHHCETTYVPTNHFDGALPRLPVPTLDASCDAYLEAVNGLEVIMFLNLVFKFLIEFTATDTK